MRWFSCLNPNSRVMLDAVEAVGKHGAFECLGGVAVALEMDEATLTDALLARWAGVKRDRASRLLPHAQAMLDEIREVTGKSPGKAPKNGGKSSDNHAEKSKKSTPKPMENDRESGKKASEKHEKSAQNHAQNPGQSDGNLPDFDASNPHGRNNITNQLEKEERDQREETDQKKPTTHLNPPAVMVGGGRFFEIDLHGESLREDEWLLRCFRERRKSQRLSLDGCDALDTLVSVYPSHYGQYKRWVTLPIEVRMAAFVYTQLNANADDPLKYALKAAEDGKGWPEVADYCRKAREMVRNDDYRVVING